MFGPPQRNAITCIIEEGLIFDYINYSAAATAETGGDANPVLVTSARSSSSDVDFEIHYENQEEYECSCTMEVGAAVNVEHGPFTITLHDALRSAQDTKPFKVLSVSWLIKLIKNT